MGLPDLAAPVKEMSVKPFEALERDRWWAFGRYQIDKLPGVSPSGEYLWGALDSGVARVYCPFAEAREVFPEFARLGRSEVPQPDRILKFTHRYGDILEGGAAAGIVERSPQHRQGSWVSLTSLAVFQREARLAYLSLRLFEQLNSTAPRADLVRTQLSHLLEHLGETELLKGVTPEDLKRWNSEPDTGQPVKTAAVVLSTVIETKLHYASSGTNSSYRYDPVTPLCNFRFEYHKQKNVPLFQPRWHFTNLLQAVWMLFFLKATGQLEQSYRICPVCEEPIVNPRKNQIYHEGCRQVQHNREKREVLRLWKEGKTVGEILEVTGLEERRVAHWVEQAGS